MELKRSIAMLLALMLLIAAPSALAKSYLISDGGYYSDTKVLVRDNGEVIVEPRQYTVIMEVSTSGGEAPACELFLAASDVIVTDEYGWDNYLHAFMDEDGNILTDYAYYWAYWVNDELLVVETPNGMGIIDKDMNVRVPFEYSQVTPVEDGGYLAIKKGSYDKPLPLMRIEPSGKVKKTGLKVFNSRLDESEGLIAASDGKKYGYLNSKGKWAIKPRYEWAETFKNGTAIVLDEEGRNGVIDTKGKWVIRPKYFNMSRGECNGADYYIANEDNKAVYVLDDAGELITKIDDAYYGYINDRGNLYVDCNDEVRLYSADGKTLFLSVSLDEYINDCSHPEESYPDRIVVTRYNDNESEYEYLLCDMNGNTIAGPYQYIGELGNGLYSFYTARTRKQWNEYWGEYYTSIVSNSERFGVLDSDGNVKLPARYDNLYWLGDGLMRASDADGWGIIDTDGNWIVHFDNYAEFMD